MKARPSWHALVRKRIGNQAPGSSRRGALRWGAAMAAAALLASGSGLAQAATGGGGSSSGGAGTGLLDSASTLMIARDGFNGVGQPTLQGRGQASIDYFWGLTVSAFQDQIGRTPGTQGVQPGQTPQDSFNAVCGAALQNAADRATAMGYPASPADSRVVGVYFTYAVGSVNWFMSSVPAGEYSDAFAPSWASEVTDPSLPGFTYDNDRTRYAQFQQDGVPALDAIASTWRSHVDSVIAANPSSGRYMTCVALNEFEPQVEFQPVISTQVTTRYVDKGESFGDDVTIALAAGDQWASVGGQNVTIRARGTVAGPVAGEKPTRATIPSGTPVAATLWLDFAGPGTKRATWTAPKSGTYSFVWEVRKADSEANGRYVRADASDSYMAPTEITTARINPQLSTQVRDRYVDVEGGALVDQVTVSLGAGDLWPQDSSGSPLPLVVRNTAYRPSNTPSASSTAVPSGAVVHGTEMVTFTAPGTKSTPGTVKRDGPGFYPWVAEIRLSDQSAEMRKHLQGAVAARFMLESETTSARHNLTHYSEVREYNVVAGGRVFDSITPGGYPDDHGSFTGLGGWQADVATATATVYGPTENRITTAAVPDGTPVFKTITLPAKNGTYNVGYGTSDVISPTQPGHYVIVYSFEGDARVAPFASPANDIRESFYVPTDGAGWLDIMSTATQNVTAGSGVMADTVLVTGTSVPEGSTLTWQTCMWVDPASPGCAQPVDTYSTTVNGTGFYSHPELDAPTLAELPAGTLEAYYGWAPVLTSPDGAVLDREPFGTPSQTTHITAELPTWSSVATPTANPGDVITDVVTFDGPTRADWTVQWEACWLSADDTCPEGTAFALGDPTRVDPAQSSMESPGWTAQVPAGTKPGTSLRVGMQPILRDALGAELLREPWGTAGQVTVVDYPLPSMTSQATSTAVLGDPTQDTVTITGPLEAGSRITWSGCYWIEVEDGSRECRQDATAVADVPVLEDGSSGLALPALAIGEPLTVESPEHTTTYGGLLPNLGLRFSWTPRISDPDGEVLVQEAAGLAEQTTTVTFPPITATTKAYSTNARGPFYGDKIGDRVEVTGDVLPGDSVTVRLYAWEKGTPPLCTGEPLATVKLDLTPSLSTYDTGPVYTTPEDRTNLVYGFQETTVSRGLTVVSKCGLAAETLPMTVDPWSQWSDSASGQQSQASGELAITGVQRLGWLFGAALVMALVGGQLVHMREKRRRVQHRASS